MLGVDEVLLGQKLQYYIGLIWAYKANRANRTYKTNRAYYPNR